MNRITTFFNRLHGLSNDYTYDFALRRLCVAKEDSWRGISPSNYSSDFNPEPPIFSAKFANCDGYRHILAIANEDGKIALQDTTIRNTDFEEKPLSAPQCHYNAVFDLEWAPGQMKFVSASGDHTARLWEVVGSEIREVNSFIGHTRSVKTAAFRKSDSSVFATGGRDGAIIIWDTRANLNVDLTPRADNCITGGHMGGPSTPTSQRKRTRTPKMTANATSSSITGLVFQDTNTLISCGAGDGIIKVWDLRRNYSCYKKEPHPKYSLPYAGSSTFKGFTNLLIDEAGGRLFANCMDNTIYCYNISAYSPKPLAMYKGLQNSTFYIKSCLSPDGKYLLSGSSNEKAYIWNLSHPSEPLVALCGHTVEVTCVAWGATHDQPIVTCSDDARHKIWRIGPENISDADRIELYRGNAEYVRQFDKKPIGSTHKYNLRDLESTPRSMKRVMEQNERTPGSMEKVSTKRSFLEMLGAVTSNEMTDDPEPKRHKTVESKGRRLFPCSSSMQPCSSSSSSMSFSRCLNIQPLPTVPEDLMSLSVMNVSPISRQPIQNKDCNQENTNESSLPCVSGKMTNPITHSPLSERAVEENLNHIYISPPSSSRSILGVAHSSTISTGSNIPSHSMASAIYSPTSNLPNYVLDGEAPHLGIMSPKRKNKTKVDWLTKIRKQKLMSSCRGTTLTDKMNEESAAGPGAGLELGACSPRLQSLRQSEGSPRLNANITRRRVSCTSQQSDALSPSISQSHHNHQQLHHPKTPTTSRRNSETTILRFFSVQTQQVQNGGGGENTSSLNEVESIGLQPLPPLPPTLSPSTSSAASSNVYSTHCTPSTSTAACTD